MSFRKTLIPIFFITLSFAVGYFIGSNSIHKDYRKIPMLEKSKPLEKYSIDNLSNTKIPVGVIEIGELIKSENNFDSYLIKFTFFPEVINTTKKSTSGFINIPKGNEKYPLVLAIRGYVDQSSYKTGDGSRRVSDYFAQNKMIVLSLDFLGYGNSDSESPNIFESRFQTYVSVLSLLESLDQLKSWDGKNVFIWGHSNGGQIALTALIISKYDIPSSLWAPVTKPFPYSVLYYTDESDDKGKLIRKELSEFENDYDVFRYSLDNYLDYLNAPLQIIQGTSDDAVPQKWSDNFVNRLKDLDKDISYELIIGADHNMNPQWKFAVNESLEHFQKYIKY